MEQLEHLNLEQAPLLANQTRYLLSKVLCFLVYLHSMHITRCDFKPTNVFFTGESP